MSLKEFLPSRRAYALESGVRLELSLACGSPVAAAMSSYLIGNNVILTGGFSLLILIAGFIVLLTSRR